MSTRDVVSGLVRDVVESGEGVVVTDRGVVFTRGVLPGEEALVRLAPKKGRIQRGSLVRIELPSAQRVEPPCPLFASCGGCPLMHADLALQRSLKQRFLRDALLKAAPESKVSIEYVPSAQTLAYRRRARLSFKKRSERTELGFKREHSDHIIDVPNCLVLVPELNRALSALRERIAGHLTGQGEILLSLSSEGRAVVVLRADDAQTPEFYARAEALVKDAVVAGVALYAAKMPTAAIFGDPTEGSIAADGLPLRGTVGGFSQAHGEMNDALARRVLELAEPRDARVLELYAGHGNLTVLLAPSASQYTAVEQDGPALEAARANLAARAISAKLVHGDALQHLGKGPLDVVVLDPPRTGAEGVLRELIKRKPKRIVYVSCDPATLGRDLKEALSSGYVIDHAACFEMFPQTADLESVVRLVRP